METNQCCGWHHGMTDSCYCEDETDYAEELIEEAMIAKKMLLREKMKAKLETKIGKKLDKLADLGVDLLLKEWDTEKKLNDAMSDQ